MTTWLVAVIALLQPARGQVRGESILGSANTNTNVTAGAPAGPVKESPVSAVRTNAGNGELIGFDQLAGYSIVITSDLALNTDHPSEADAKVNAMIPANVRAFDGRNVSVEGFMIPMDFEKDKVIAFMLARDPMGCCYSTIPEIHQYIKVRVKSPGVDPIMYSTARARGVLHVGADRENGYLSSIYRLDAETVKDTGK